MHIAGTAEAVSVAGRPPVAQEVAGPAVVHFLAVPAVVPPTAPRLTARCTPVFENEFLAASMIMQIKVLGDSPCQLFIGPGP